ncbi:MAG: cytidyltransferase, partial [Lachnospiraceae bacterium]|nr:cytidyltransferase [Lachnospiraceae bacterium]
LVVKDTMGAENAFLAAACLFAAAGAPVEMGTFIGNTAGALSTNIVGNSKKISKVDILRFASTLLNI